MSRYAEAMRDKPVLGRPEEPPGDDCCERLEDAIRDQTRLLQRLLKYKSQQPAGAS